MKEIFNRRFWKYFITTFILVQLFSALGAGNNYLDLFIANSDPLKVFCKLCLYVALGLIPAALCLSTALASFISFRNLQPGIGVKGFFRKLVTGLLCFISLAAAIYLFDLYIQPHFQARVTGILWELKTGNYLREVDDTSMQAPVFVNYSPGLSTKEVLCFRLDSLEAECNELRSECSRLLVQLPDSAAAKAYEAYRLEWLGVAYQHAPSSINPGGDSIVYIRQEELFYAAGHLHESNIERLMYHFERYKRMMNSVVLLLQFLIFAALGYFFRKKAMKTILGIIAIIVVAGLFLNQVTAMGKRYADEAKRNANNIENTYKRSLRN